MTYSSYCESADFLRTRLNGFTPEALLILGSGLGFLGDMVEDPIFVDYGEIPHFRPSTAPGHKGRFVFGTLRGRRVAVMQGRMHCYEGYTMAEAAYAVRVVRLLGAKTLFVTNAAGCVNTDWNVGELMLISDHIKLFDFGPLCGPNLEEFGTRFPDMSSVYTPRLRALAHEAAKAHNIPLREGVYMYFPGPQFETPAEVRAARVLGARRGRYVHRARDHRRRPLRHGGHGRDAARQHGGGRPPAAALRRGGQRGRRGGGPRVFGISSVLSGISLIGKGPFYGY